MFFPTEQCRQLFYKQVQDLTVNQKMTVMDLESEFSSGPIQVLNANLIYHIQYPDTNSQFSHQPFSTVH